MIRRPPRSTLSSSSAASDVYKRQGLKGEPLARVTLYYTKCVHMWVSCYCYCLYVRYIDHNMINDKSNAIYQKGKLRCFCVPPRYAQRAYLGGTPILVVSWIAGYCYLPLPHLDGIDVFGLLRRPKKARESVPVKTSR